LFLACGITGGLGLALGMALVGIEMPLEAVETGAQFMLLVFPVLLLIYLWSAANAMPAGKASVKELIQGSAVPWFWGGLIVCGIVIPGIVAAYGLFRGEVSHPLLFLSVVGEVVGGLSLRYCILKVGIYSPLIPLRS
jgi:formate-dependent nitrite reductase membrane component NrfD